MDLNENLEKKVNERTEQLNHSLNETNSLLNNMKQSVFSVDKEGIIIPPVSQYSNEIFGGKLDGKSVYDTLFKDLNKDSEEIFYLNNCRKKLGGFLPERKIKYKKINLPKLELFSELF